MRAEKRSLELPALVQGYLFTCWAQDSESTILLISKDPAFVVEPGRHGGHVIGLDAAFEIVEVSPNQAFVTAVTRVPLATFREASGVMRAERDVIIYALRDGGA